MTKCMPKIVADSDNTQEGEVGNMDTQVGDVGTLVEGTGLEKHKDASDIKGPQKKHKILEMQQRIGSDVEPGKAQEGEPGDSMVSVELPESPKTEKTTNEAMLQAEQDGKALNLEDVVVECQNQQDAKKLIDDLRNKIELLKAENLELQTDIGEVSITLRNTNLEADILNEVLKVKEGADRYTRPKSALQTLSARDVLHEIKETESLISQPASLLPEQQDQNQLEAQKSELEREREELRQESRQIQKEIDYLRDRHNELVGMIETEKTAHKEKVEEIRRDLVDSEEECKVIKICNDGWSGWMLKLEEECREMKETAEPMIRSMNDAVLRLESEVVERFRNIQMRLCACRNELQIAKAKLALHHDNQGLAIENERIERELQAMGLTVLELLKQGRQLEAELYDEEGINRMLAILYSRNDDSEVQEGGAGDVVASGGICQSEEAENTTDKEILQALQDEKALNLEDVAVSSEKQQGSRKIVDVLRREVEWLEAENMRLQIGIDKISNMIIDTNLEVDNLNEALKTLEGADEFVRPAFALQTSSDQDVLHEAEEAETLIGQPEVSLFQQPQDQSQLEAPNSDLEKEIQEMRKQSSLNQKEIDELRVYGSDLTEMIETAKTAHGRKVEGTWRDIENYKRECKSLKLYIQRWSDRAGTLQEELRQMKEITTPAIHSLHGALLNLKLQVEEQFRNIQMRLSACREELQTQKARLMTVHDENEEYTTMNRWMERAEWDMVVVGLQMDVELEEKSEWGLHDAERVKKMGDVAEAEKMLGELKMREKDLELRMSSLKEQKTNHMVVLSLQYEQYVQDCRKLCQLIHRSCSKWERLGQMLRQGPI